MASLNVLDRAVKKAYEEGEVSRPFMRRWGQVWDDWQLACMAMKSSDVRKEGLLDWWFAARSALVSAYTQLEQAVDH